MLFKLLLHRGQGSAFPNRQSKGRSVERCAAKPPQAPSPGSRATVTSSPQATAGSRAGREAPVSGLQEKTSPAGQAHYVTQGRVTNWLSL